jgi:glycylpeptide N-tetradecanoyltransferase
MPQEASKLSNPDETADAAPEATAESSKQNAAAESADESDEEPAAVEGGEGAEKKKSRKRKIKDALTGKGKAPEITSTESPAGGHLSKDQMTQLLESNPALKQELMAKSKNPKDLEQMIRKLNINEMLTGLAPEGKNTKDMASHAFWKTQPEMAAKEKIDDGPIKHIEIDKVDKNPSPMYPGFEWVTMDLEDEKQLDEVYDLLTNHYVEDKDATFRFKYSPSFLNWYVYRAPPCARLTTTGPSKHPAGRKSGTSAYAQPAQASS